MADFYDRKTSRRLVIIVPGEIDIIGDHVTMSQTGYSKYEDMNVNPGPYQFLIICMWKCTNALYSND